MSTFEEAMKFIESFIDPVTYVEFSDIQPNTAYLNSNGYIIYQCSVGTNVYYIKRGETIYTFKGGIDNLLKLATLDDLVTELSLVNNNGSRIGESYYNRIRSNLLKFKIYV